MKHAARETRLRIFKVTLIFSLAAVVLWVGLSVALALSEKTSLLREKLLRAAEGSSFGFYQEWVALRVDRFLGDLLIWSPQQLIPLVLFVCALIGLRMTASVCARQNRWGTGLVAVAVIAEVSLFAARWVVWTDPTVYPLFPDTAESRVLQERVGRSGRVSTIIHPSAHMALTPFIPNTLSAYGVATISGYDSIVPDGMVIPNESPGDARKMGRLGVSHLITWSGNSDVPSDWQLVWQSSKMDLYENPQRVSRYVGFSDMGEKEAFFAGTLREFKVLRETGGKENGRRIEIPAGIRWIRVAENQAAGWEYCIGDASSWKAVERAPDASMLMENTQHSTATQIQMRYAPPARKYGLLISGLSLLMLGVSSRKELRSA
jgi:hypothetical protein